ncbi:MAG: alkaline phosphatase D family protein [Verrucomicrobiales bacterium]|nr:alkaline phosphatase D family protein [Verrucomicrobiales bacterium]
MIHRFFTLCLLPAASALAADVYQAQGLMSGELTQTQVLLQTRLTAIPGPTLDEAGDVPGSPGWVAFEWSERPDFEGGKRSATMEALAERDYIVRQQVSDLQPGQAYYFRSWIGASAQDLHAGLTGRFQTLPAADSESEIQFCMGSCMNYHKFLDGKKAGGDVKVVTASAEDKQLGYPVFAAMEALHPQFFIGTGDIVYYDNKMNGPAETLPQLRACWHEQFRFPRLVSFFENVPGYWSKDDHDFRFNDSDNASAKLPLPQTGIEIFREQMPIFPLGDETTPTYRTHRLNRYVQLWFSEGRDFRSPNKMPDGPQKTLWGAEQKAWLERTLKESDATWKILISPTPMVGPDDAKKRDNHANLGGFRHEADEFFAWLEAEKIEGFMTFCGDRHWQFHSIHPSGVEEFACGALNDENSRVGVKPGAKNGTDPKGLIQQPYTYEHPTGGFLHVICQANGQLTIEFRDDEGTLLHEVKKMP